MTGIETLINAVRRESSRPERRRGRNFQFVRSAKLAPSSSQLPVHSARAPFHDRVVVVVVVVVVLSSSPSAAVVVVMPPKKQKRAPRRRAPGGGTIAALLATLDVPADALAAANTLEEEFNVIKRAFHVAAKTHHPDKGGDEAAFRDVRAAFDVLKQKFTDASGGSFSYKTARGSKASTAKEWKDASATADDTHRPSYDFYAAAAEADMPLYRAELAKRCDETRRRTRVRIIFRTAVDVVASPSPRLTPVHPSSLLLVRPSRAARRVAVTGASATRTTARTATTASSKTRSRSRRVTSESACWTRRAAGAFYTPVPIRPRSRGERHSLRTFFSFHPTASHAPPLARRASLLENALVRRALPSVRLLSSTR